MLFTWQSICLYILISIVNGLIKDEPMPKEFYECYFNKTSDRDITSTASYSIQHQCINYFWTKTFRDRYHQEIDPSVLPWIQTLDANLHLRRQKRQQWRPLRRRKEIRMLSENERRAFFNAVVALKEDRTIRPNMYDAIASLHNAAAVQSAHFGPNFLGWHRYFLYIFEEALRSKDLSVTLPYWDSTFDFNMDTEDPVNSVIWSDIFVGNGNGFVNSGPFANWLSLNNAPLGRNIGSPGSLMTPEGIRAVLSQTFHRDITQPTATDVNDLEGIHNNVHAWIGGDMGGLTTSAYDPIFFLHHCFVDYVWEQFRFRQFNRGINPQNDFPNTGADGHWPWSVMVNLGRLRNVDGYHNAFTQFIYEYESSPSCSNNCGNSAYLECDSTRQLCVSTTSREFQMGGRRQNRPNMNFGAPIASLMRNNPGRGMAFRNNPRETSSNTQQKQKFVPTLIDPRTQKNRVKRATYNRQMLAAKPRFFSKNRNLHMSANTSPFSSIFFDTPFGKLESSISHIVQTSANIELPQTANFESAFTSTRVNRRTGQSNSRNPLSHPEVLQSKSKPIQNGLRTSNGNQETARVKATNFNPQHNQLNSPRRTDFVSTSGDIRSTKRSSFIDFAIQNNFAMDGVADVGRWVFTPVRIIYRRPPGSSFNCKIVKNGRIVDGHDFYSPSHYLNLQQQVRTGNPATYQKEVRSGSGASKIFVQSDGLTYEGKYIDYAIVDERQPISEAVTYVAIKNPGLGSSKSYISAYDANGRVCQPRCLVPGSRPPSYKVCSGTISVTEARPKMYGNTYGDAVMNRYSFNNDDCPTNKDDDIFLTFYCDYENQWPWINYPHLK